MAALSKVASIEQLRDREMAAHDTRVREVAQKLEQLGKQVTDMTNLIITMRIAVDNAEQQMQQLQEMQEQTQEQTQAQQ